MVEKTKIKINNNDDSDSDNNIYLYNVPWMKILKELVRKSRLKESDFFHYFDIVLGILQNYPIGTTETILVTEFFKKSLEINFHNQISKSKSNNFDINWRNETSLKTIFETGFIPKNEIFQFKIIGYNTVYKSDTSTNEYNNVYSLDFCELEDQKSQNIDSMSLFVPKSYNFMIFSKVFNRFLCSDLKLIGYKQNVNFIEKDVLKVISRNLFIPIFDILDYKDNELESGKLLFNFIMKNFPENVIIGSIHSNILINVIDSKSDKLPFISLGVIRIISIGNKENDKFQLIRFEEFTLDSNKVVIKEKHLLLFNNSLILNNILNVGDFYIIGGLNKQVLDEQTVFVDPFKKERVEWCRNKNIKECFSFQAGSILIYCNMMKEINNKDSEKLNVSLEKFNFMGRIVDIKIVNSNNYCISISINRNEKIEIQKINISKHFLLSDIYPIHIGQIWSFKMLSRLNEIYQFNSDSKAINLDRQLVVVKSHKLLCKDLLVDSMHINKLYNSNSFILLNLILSKWEINGLDLMDRLNEPVIESPPKRKRIDPLKEKGLEIKTIPMVPFHLICESPVKIHYDDLMTCENCNSGVVLSSNMIYYVPNISFSTNIKIGPNFESFNLICTSYNALCSIFKQSFIKNPNTSYLNPEEYLKNNQSRWNCIVVPNIKIKESKFLIIETLYQKEKYE